MRFTIRDVLWLMVVAALAVAWWSDQDRIRRERAMLQDERAALRATVQRLQSIPLRRAEAALGVAEAELASLLEIKQRNPGAVPQGELRRLELKVEVARLEVERARAKDDFAAAAIGRAKPARP